MIGELHDDTAGCDAEGGSAGHTPPRGTSRVPPSSSACSYPTDTSFSWFDCWCASLRVWAAGVRPVASMCV